MDEPRLIVVVLSELEDMDHNQRSEFFDKLFDNYCKECYDSLPCGCNLYE